MVDLNFINNENTQGFFKEDRFVRCVCIHGPSLLGREGDGIASFLKSLPLPC